MCGLAGILGDGARQTGLLQAMATTIAHRGPDDEGVWTSSDAAIGLAHRRLAVVDLSPMGHQPMASRNGRFVIAFNGEIYNHFAIRAEIEAQRAIEWHGHSDTETLVEAIAEWGVAGALKRSIGMFAFAVWDQKERTLQLARDRFGEKPLYYGWVGQDFVFASELKALRRHPSFSASINRAALRLFAARAYVPAPFSIHERIYKLEPGCILTCTSEVGQHAEAQPPRAGRVSRWLTIERYWSFRDVTNSGLKNPLVSEADALDGLEAVVSQAISGQAVADVSVGAFLSGGIDSAAVVGLYQKHSPGRVKTFSLGFEEAGFDEASHAREMAAHFGTEHHERYVSVADAQSVIPLLPDMYDEPFADSSQIPTYLVSRFAREHVTVALSGDGGDELFAGYNRYIRTAQMWRHIKRLPQPLRTAFGGVIASAPTELWDKLVRILPAQHRPAHFGNRLRKAFLTMRDARDLDDVAASFLDEWDGYNSPILPLAPLPAEGAYDMALAAGAPAITRMMYCDATSYLPDDILCKVDRAAMAVSLETRIPFLDHRVAEFAARIPVSMQVRGTTGKSVLRQLLNRYAPSEMYDRPKRGFAVPVGQWMRGPLRDWAEDLLDERRLTEDGYYNAAMVRSRWQSHLSGERDSTQALWAVLMFSAWRKSQLSNG